MLSFSVIVEITSLVMAGISVSCIVYLAHAVNSVDEIGNRKVKSVKRYNGNNRP
jgi:hypothetical protein